MQTKCLYTSKPCNNLRSTKDNGELHRLCMVHRMKANDAQRRWHSRQRSSPPTSDPESEVPTLMTMPTPSKRRRTAETKASKISEPKRRRIHPAKLAQPRSWSMPMTAPLAIPSSMPFTDLLTATPTVAASAFQEEELAELGEFIVELEPSQLRTRCEVSGWSSNNAFENEWWLTHEPSADGSVFLVK